VYFPSKQESPLKTSEYFNGAAVAPVQKFALDTRPKNWLKKDGDEIRKNFGKNEDSRKSVTKIQTASLDEEK